MENVVDILNHLKVKIIWILQMEQIYYVVTSAGRKNHKSTINNRFFVFLLFIFFDGYCKLMEEYIINFQIIIDNKPNKNKKQTHTKIYG